MAQLHSPVKITTKAPRHEEILTLGVFVSWWSKSFSSFVACDGTWGIPSFRHSIEGCRECATAGGTCRGSSPAGVNVLASGARSIMVRSSSPPQDMGDASDRNGDPIRAIDVQARHRPRLPAIPTTRLQIPREYVPLQGVSQCGLPNHIHLSIAVVGLHSTSEPKAHSLMRKITGRMSSSLVHSQYRTRIV